MKVIANIIKYIAIILLTCTIIGCVIINIVSSTVLKKDYILSKLEETNYYSKIKEEIESNFENYIGQSGLDENVVKNIVTIEQIKEDTNTIIENIYDGVEKTVDTTTIETNLHNNIKESLGNTQLTATQQKAIDEYVKTIIEQYKETMSHTNYETQINQMIKKVNKYVDLANKVVIIATAILVLLIIVFNYKNIIKAISNIGISLISSGAFYIILKIYIDSKIKISNIVIINESVSNTLKTILNEILSKINKNGIILAICGIILVILGNTIISLKKKKKESEE